MKDLFVHGATWFRADFHLHTKADKEFSYSGEEDHYVSSYVKALIDAGISIGVITNHNKFDFEEFKALRNAAKKQDVLLLPGVELSVNDGASGIHVLIVFADSWIENNQDRVSPFLTTMFPGKTVAEYQNENGRSDRTILQLVEELQKVGKDYFLIFAHVEESKGLWAEMKGGKFSDWTTDRYAEVCRHTLGFQKVRTHDKPDVVCRVKVKEWLGKFYPAEVEGSDPKSIEEIGKGKTCFVKLGAFTFDAVRFALIDHENRLRTEQVPEYAHSHIKQIRFEGGTLDGQTICFSPELNTLIGIRGSGKSSVLEALRYVLGIQVGVSDSERVYKEKLVERTLGSGGKVILDATDRHGQQYQVRRIWKESANVFIGEKLQPGISIRETVLKKPLFFGQEELATAGKGSEKELIEKLLGDQCDEVRRQIAEQETRVTDAIERLSKVRDVGELIQEQEKIKQDAQFRLNFYREHHLEEKLQKRLGFEGDIRKAEEGVTLVQNFTAAIRDLLATHEDELRNFLGHSSIDNAEFFEEFDVLFGQVVQSLDTMKLELAKSEDVLGALKKAQEKLIADKNSLADEFAAVERALMEDLKSSDVPNISTDEFLAAKRKLAAAEAKLAEFSKNSDQKVVIQTELSEELQKLNELWLKEFRIIKEELDRVSQKNSALKFDVEFKEDKKAFRDYFKSVFKGSGVRDQTYDRITENYRDFAAIYSDFENAKQFFGSNPDNFAGLFEKNLKDLLTYQTPNKFTIFYRGMELENHSLGQRASALILFVLGQRDNDVMIIDQPEDDLDNQTIYEDVIKLIRELKPSVQFIFATHNPNIPVLGDAEQIHCCLFASEKIDVLGGGLDDPAQQKRIVNIMEGGKEAFERREEIYRTWKT